VCGLCRACDGIGPVCVLRGVCIGAPVSQTENPLYKRIGQGQIRAEYRCIRLSKVPDRPLSSKGICERVVFVEDCCDDGERSYTEDHEKDRFVLLR